MNAVTVGSNSLGATTQSVSGGPTILRRWGRWLVVCSGLACVSVPAWLPAQHRFETQLGTFLTHDRGWNWELNASGRVGVASHLTEAWWGVSYATGRLSACPCGDIPSIPAAPESIENGLATGYELQRRVLSQRVTGLLGVEWFHVLGEDQARGSSWTGSVGVGWFWDARARWGTELRYEALARRLSATRGRLEWALVRRW